MTKTKVRRVDWRADDFIAGLAGHRLGADGWGVYIGIISICYAEGRASLPAEELVDRLASLMGADPRTIRAAIGKLERSAKISRDGSEIEPRRVRDELEMAVKRVRDYREMAARGGRVSGKTRRDLRENKDLDEAQALKAVHLDSNPQQPATSNQQPTVSIKERIPPCGGGGLAGSAGVAVSIMNGTQITVPLDEVRMAVSLYNDMAKRTGLPQARVQTEARRRLIEARIRDSGGLDGFRDVLTKVELSDFLSGRAGRGAGHENWQCHLGWIVKLENWTKIQEGVFSGAARPARPTVRSMGQVAQEWLAGAEPEGVPDGE